MIYWKYNNSTIAAEKIGNGAQLLVMLHGFGDSQAAVRHIADIAANELDYTVYCLDLPFHGATIWTEDTFSPDDLCAIIKNIQEREPRKALSVFGYSLGGRLLLSILPNLTASAVFLSAPEGAPSPFFYRTLYIPIWIKKIIEALVRKMPKITLQTARFLRQRGWVTRFVAGFIERHFANETSYERIFGTWKALSYFPISSRSCNEAIKQHNMKVHLCFGKSDRVLSQNTPEWFMQHIHHESLYILEGGHSAVLQQSGKWMRELHGV